MALSVSHPVSTQDTNIIPRALARGMILVEGWYRMWYGKSHIILCLSYTLNMRKFCSVLWTFIHVINIILRGMIKGWWYWYQSWQTNTVVMFFQYYIYANFLYLVLCTFLYMINREYYMALSVSHPVSTRDTDIIPRALESLVLYYELWCRCSHVINIILRGMIKEWWYTRRR